MQLIREINDGFKIQNPKDVLKYVEEFKDEDREHFIALGLDTNNKVMYRDIVSIGTLNSGVVHPREVFKKAIINSVNSIIVLHNHPSGTTTPSKEDIEVSKKLKSAGDILDIKVIDFLILTTEGLFSYSTNID